MLTVVANTADVIITKMTNGEYLVRVAGQSSEKEALLTPPEFAKAITGEYAQALGDAEVFVSKTTAGWYFLRITDASGQLEVKLSAESFARAIMRENVQGEIL